MAGNYRDTLNNIEVTTPVDIEWLMEWIKTHEKWFEIRYVKFMLQDWEFKCRQDKELEELEEHVWDNYEKEKEEETSDEYI